MKMQKFITYPTIKDAFAQGSGDVFFKNQSGFIAVSRHSVNFGEMEAAGFIYMSYQETLDTAAAQNPAPSPVQSPAKKEARGPKKFVNYPDMEVQGFYDEFPDAYNQNL